MSAVPRACSSPIASFTETVADSVSLSMPDPMPKRIAVTCVENCKRAVVVVVVVGHSNVHMIGNIMRNAIDHAWPREFK
jgi:hypothetical protein